MTPETADARPDDPSRSCRWIAERVRAWDERVHVPWHPTRGWARQIRGDLVRLLSGFRAVELLARRVATILGVAADDYTGEFERPVRPMIQPSLRSHTRAASMARRSPGSATRGILTHFSWALPVERARTLPPCQTSPYAETLAQATRTSRHVGSWISSATPSVSPT